MKQAVKLGQNLVLNADTSSPEVSSLRQEVKEIPDRFDELKNQLTEQQAQLKSIIRDSTEFQQHIRELELWVTEVSESTAMQEPISTNPKVVHKRLELTEVSVTCPKEPTWFLLMKPKKSILVLISAVLHCISRVDSSIKFVP